MLLGLGNISSNLLGVFMFLAGNLARVGVWAASRLGWAGFADLFEANWNGEAIAGGRIDGHEELQPTG